MSTRWAGKKLIFRRPEFAARIWRVFGARGDGRGLGDWIIIIIIIIIIIVIIIKIVALDLRVYAVTNRERSLL